jgi:hypothetical protein
VGFYSLSLQFHTRLRRRTLVPTNQGTLTNLTLREPQTRSKSTQQYLLPASTFPPALPSSLADAQTSSIAQVFEQCRVGPQLGLAGWRILNLH